MSYTTIKTICSCGSSKLSFSVETDSLPLPAYLCHCDVSRRISGAICTSYVSAGHSSGLSPADWKTTLTPYRSSVAYKRHFCTTCGTHMVFEHIDSGTVHVATGTIDAATSDEIIDFKGHMWIHSSKDGGVSDFIPTISDHVADRWSVEAGESEQLPRGWRSDLQALEVEANEDFIPLHCHCNCVQLRITRPTEASKAIKHRGESPDWPDLIVPAHSGEQIKNEQGYPWWLSSDGKRYLAGTCTCTSCRLGTGFDIMSWTFVPLDNIQLMDGTTIQGVEDGLEADTRVDKMLSMYKSRNSDGVKRYFCPACGASVLWFSPERPRLLDVATALLDAPSGVRAGTLLDWNTERVSYCEEALHKGLVEGLQQGLKQWKGNRDIRTD